MRHPLPAPVQVGGKTYRFRYDNKLLDRDLLGETSCNDGEIAVASQSATIPKRLRETVIHELLHSIAHEWQMPGLNDNSDEAERIIRSFATGLLQVLPQIEDWLIETRRATEAT